MALISTEFLSKTLSSSLTISRQNDKIVVISTRAIPRRNILCYLAVQILRKDDTAGIPHCRSIVLPSGKISPTFSGIIPLNDSSICPIWRNKPVIGHILESGDQYNAQVENLECQKPVAGYYRFLSITSTKDIPQGAPIILDEDLRVDMRNCGYLRQTPWLPDTIKSLLEAGSTAYQHRD